MNPIIPEHNHEEKQIRSTIKRFFKEYHIAALLRQSNFFKAKGFSASFLFEFIFSLIFSGKNLFRLLDSSSKTNCGKDAVYRFPNSARYNWRKFLLALASVIIKQKVSPLTSDERENVLIVDDSL